MSEETEEEKREREEQERREREEQERREAWNRQISRQISQLQTAKSSISSLYDSIAKLEATTKENVTVDDKVYQAELFSSMKSNLSTAKSTISDTAIPSLRRMMY